MFRPSLIGASGTKALQSSTLNVPGDFPTISDALAFIDGNPILSGARFTIRIAATPNGFYRESLRFVKRHYQNVTIEGAAPIVATSTSVAVSGVAPDWTVVLTFANNVLSTAALAAKFVTIQAISDPGNAADAGLSGTWEVVSTTATTVTLKVLVWGLASMSATPPSGQFKAIAFPTRLRSAYLPGFLKDAFFAGVNSTLPTLKNLLLDGDRSFDGTNIEQVGISLDNSNITIQSDYADLPGIAITRTSAGLSVGSCSTFYGALSVSDCQTNGITCVGASRMFSPLLMSQGNQGLGCGVSQSSYAAISPSDMSAPSRLCGNYGSGLSIAEGAHAIMTSGSIIANFTSAQVLAQSTGLTTLGGTAQLLTGTISPTANTAGNFNSYNRRY
ncbi:hypothetical protein HB770_04110 [Rhizobium leguminosarum bv. viciae]|uniref:Uncharacterized protein n=1 Tax=Rhizobium leguminosarum bv. viciae TaxID=387 RepID=A0A7G6RHU8_RHILV|nr:hypothetical protein HB770_04110 [Rhizobium leguminosarum bv. viciae]